MILIIPLYYLSRREYVTWLHSIFMRHHTEEIDLSFSMHEERDKSRNVGFSDSLLQYTLVSKS